MATYTGRFDGSNAKHASPAMAALSGSNGVNQQVDNLPTSTKWSVLSSRVEGLVAELNEVVGKQDAYCVSVSGHEGKAMEAVRQKMLATPWGQEWTEGKTMFSYGEEMSTDPLEALFLKQLVFMAKPKRVLEVGMFVGYGAAAMLEGSPTVQVVSLEIDPYLKTWLQSCLADAGMAHFSERHEILLGPALESLLKLSGAFDMVFVDANKAEYKQYVDDILRMNLLAPGGVIVCDNVLYNGLPYTSKHFDAQPARRGFGDAIKEFNQWIADHPVLEQVMLPVRDGISLVRRSSDVPGAAPCSPSGNLGNLVQFDDTWHITSDGQKDIPANALISDCRIDTSKSEYQKEGECSTVPQAWWSKSFIPFEYRVVEVPSGELLNPDCDALIFGHLKPGSKARSEAMAKPQRRLIVIDEKVNSFYGERVTAYFKARGVVHEMLVLNTCEENKSVELTLAVCTKMKKFNIDRRQEPVIAIGGGVCLDVVGLASSLFRRRTPYIRVPTTALAYVDASVGAKNGCNFAGSKNRLGTYVPPVAALLDSSFFRTQGARDISNSLGEMCKMGIMKSAELLELLENNGPRLIADRFAPRSSEDAVPARVLQIAIETMMEELTPNLWEDCLDRLVDFGHGVGQNLEMLALGTDQELMHGEAVATDMAFMTVLSNVLGNLSDSDRDRILFILNNCGLPTYHPALTREFFKEAMADRIKNSLGMRLPLPVGMGRARMFNDVTDAQFEATFVLWERLCKDNSVTVGAPLPAAESTTDPVVNVTMVCCGAPKRSMGWYHCKQMLEPSMSKVRLAHIVEPFFMGAGKSLPAAAEFSAWASTKANAGVHADIADMPKPSGPSLAVICGRTADNPKLFRQAVDHGFKHIYLEKPGAPTVAELEEMDKYSKAKGVAVCMGFNRNYSKYVSLAKNFMANAPEGSSLTLGRNDAFNTPEALDECFERNREGMMKNMMIHELVVLISHFGVKVADIAEIVNDNKYTCQEERKGVVDFSKVGFTLVMKNGRKFYLWGDRCNGEYAEAIIRADGVEFKTVRPDPKLASVAAEIEKEEPGCMPFFYLQDGEYRALKQTIVDHIVEGKSGVPAGIATIDTAIEGLKLCDVINKALGA